MILMCNEGPNYYIGSQSGLGDGDVRLCAGGAPFCSGPSLGGGSTSSQSSDAAAEALAAL